MAKKRSSSRKGGSRKKAAPRKAARKKTAKKRARSAAAAAPMVPKTGGKINFTDLKARIQAHVDELKKIESPDVQVTSAIQTLERTRADMAAICTPTMTIP